MEPMQDNEPRSADEEMIGWAILEIFGHDKYAGLVNTQMMGDACMFRIAVPALPEREMVLKAYRYVDSAAERVYAPPGSTVKAPAVEGFIKLFGAKAIFSVTPVTQAVCMAMVEELRGGSGLVFVSRPANEIAAAAQGGLDRLAFTSGGPLDEEDEEGDER